MSERVGIIFADQREADPLVRIWQRIHSPWLPARTKAFQQGSTIALVAGMGAKRAAVAARALVEEFSPALLVSAGFAGSTEAGLLPPAVICPGRIVNGTTGDVYVVTAGAADQTTLVTSAGVAGEAEKVAFATRFAAQAVDMEAATVAEIARAAGVPFRAVKAISERLDFPLPPFDRFIDEAGDFRLASFVLYAAFHPKHWRPLKTLWRDSSRAAEALANALRQI